MLINKTADQSAQEYEDKDKVARYAIQDVRLGWFRRLLRWLKGIR